MHFSWMFAMIAANWRETETYLCFGKIERENAFFSSPGWWRAQVHVVPNYFRFAKILFWLSKNRQAHTHVLLLSVSSSDHLEANLLNMNTPWKSLSYLSFIRRIHKVKKSLSVFTRSQKKEIIYLGNKKNMDIFSKECKNTTGIWFKLK